MRNVGRWVAQVQATEPLAVSRAVVLLTTALVMVPAAGKSVAVWGPAHNAVLALASIVLVSLWLAQLRWSWARSPVLAWCELPAVLFVGAIPGMVGPGMVVAGCAIAARAAYGTHRDTALRLPAYLVVVFTIDVVSRVPGNFNPANVLILDLVSVVVVSATVRMTIGSLARVAEAAARTAVLARTAADLLEAADAADVLRITMAGADGIVPATNRLRFVATLAAPTAEVPTSQVPMRFDTGQGWVDLEGPALEHSTAEALAALFAQSVSALRAVELRARLERQATRDPLTGLANRIRFLERLHKIADQGKLAAIFFIDLDDFKGINDRFGHAAGDLVLESVANRLSSLIDVDGLAARLGGDEFAALFTTVATGDDCEQTAARIVATLGAPVMYGGASLPVGVSVGGTLVEPLTQGGTGQIDDHVKAALLHADQAMYAAKAQGKNGFCVLNGVFLPTIAPTVSLPGIHQERSPRARPAAPRTRATRREAP